MSTDPGQARSRHPGAAFGLLLALVGLVSASCGGNICEARWVNQNEFTESTLAPIGPDGSERLVTRRGIESDIISRLDMAGHEVVTETGEVAVPQPPDSLGPVSPADVFLLQVDGRLIAFALSDDAPGSAPVRERNAEGWWLAATLEEASGCRAGT